MDDNLESRGNNVASRLVSLKNKKNNSNLLVHEIYTSVQGESSFAGIPCVFVRTTACHLRCSYCDTRHAFYDGVEMEIGDVIKRIQTYGIKLIELTGGEPLLQSASLDLMSKLCSLGYTVLVETSGAVSIKNVDRRVHVILDVKTPGSGEVARNIWSNLEILWPKCEVKFVICDRSDYEFAKKIVADYDLLQKCRVLFSPEESFPNKSDLAEWMVADKINAQFQIQLHKVLWGNKRGV